MEYISDGNSYLAIDGATVAARIDFTIDDGVVTIHHTGTAPAYRGQGLAERITEYALAEIAKNGQKVQPRCPYTAKHFANHPELSNLLT